jgi:hypothetical protein
MILNLLIFFILSISNFSYAGTCDAQAQQAVDEAPPPELPGYFSISFKNLTQNAYADDQIFLQFFGLNGPALPNKKLRAVSVSLSGTNNYGSLGNQVLAPTNTILPAIKLSELKNKTLYLPQAASKQYPENGKFYGARIYISLGAPLTTLRVNADGSGTSQPTFADNDQSVNNIFDWIEFTYDPENSAGGPTKVTFGGNPTGVDQFGIPLWMKIYGTKGSVDGPVGIILRDNKYAPSCIGSRSEIINNFLSAVSAPFKKLLQGKNNNRVARILSPVKSANFMQEAKTYFDSYINEVWQFFSTHELKFCDVYDPKSNQAPWGSCYEGKVQGNDLVFYRSSGRPQGAAADCTKEKPCKMPKPQSQEVFENGGVFALPDNRQKYPQGVVDYNLLASQLAAAIARHTATQVFASGNLKGYVDWHGKSLGLYSAKPKHEYAEYFHKLGIHHRFYGMGYDDVGAPPKHEEARDQRPVGGPLVFMNQPGEAVRALIIGIQD